MDTCGHILTELSDFLDTESGDRLVTECFSPSPFINQPGRVYSGAYPYFKPRNKPAWEEYEQEEDEEFEEIMAMLGIEL